MRSRSEDGVVHVSYFWRGYDDYRLQRVTNLAQLTIPDESMCPERGKPLQDFSATSDDGTVRVLFRNLEAELIAMIGKADLVVGCVAWLTSEPILRALACTRGTQIVVQKEDFLRPDLDTPNAWARRLRALYGELHMPVTRYELPPPVGMMSFCGDPTVEAVRCVGNHNRTRSPAFPRAHHKFVVFCRDGLDPYAVWTGSFNFTKNGNASLENALVLTDPTITRAYLSEWAQILAISEPLDWRAEWVAPQWRIGS